MALTFSGQRYASTGNPAHIWYSQSQATQSYKLQIVSSVLGSIPAGLGLIARNVFDFTEGFYGGAALVLRINLTGVNGSVQGDFPIPDNNVHIFVIVWDGVAGVQTVFMDAVPTVIGNVSGNTTSRTDSINLGPNVSQTALVYTLDDVNHWDGGAAVLSDAQYLTNNGDPTAVSFSHTYRSRWTLSGTTGNNAAPGDTGLSNSYLGSDDGSYLSSITGAGTAVYGPSLVWVPTVTGNMYVCGSGKLIGGTMNANSDGSLQVLSKVLTMPTLFVNSVNEGQLINEWLTGGHECFLASTPLVGGVPLQILPTDIVSLVAPPVWANTRGGGVGALSGTIDNRTGKSSTKVESVTKTLFPGLNMSAASGAAPEYYPWKNMKYLAGHQNNPGKMYPGTVPLTTSPGETGLWLVVWDATNPGVNASMFAVVSGDPSLLTSTHQAAYDINPGGIAGANGYGRVFDVEPVGGSAWNYTFSGFQIVLTNTDPLYGSGPANYSNLWIYAPGEWSIVGGVPVFDRSDALALSSIFLDRVPSGLTTIRFDDIAPGPAVTGGSCPVPELLVPSSTEFFWGNNVSGQAITYTQIDPVDTTATPYIYHPSFGKVAGAGSTYTATLGAAVTTSPAQGTVETWTINDSPSAPLMAQSEADLGTERIRIISGVTPTWQVYRGSGGTTPITHLNGATLTVYGRRAITDRLFSNGKATSAVVFQITTSIPHGIMSMQGLSKQGAIVNITLDDGFVYNNVGFGLNYVTGPNTLVNITEGYGSPGGAKPNGSYPLSGVFGQQNYPTGVPYQVQCDVARRFPHCGIHINITCDACDDMFWTIARMVRDNFPTGNPVFAEYANEIWNSSGAFGSFFYCSELWPLGMPSSLLFVPQTQAYGAYRAAQMHQIFRSVFSAAGRLSDLVCGIGVNMAGATEQTTPELNLGITVGAPFDAIFVAPYTDINFGGYSQTLPIINIYDDDQACNLFEHDFTYDSSTSGIRGWLAAQTAAIAAYKLANPGKNCFLMGYEGGIQKPVFNDPDGGTYGDWREHDIHYNPNIYWAEQALYVLFQKYLRFINLYGLGIGWGGDHSAAWAIYHTRTQKHSRGDGVGGASNNRHNMANPGSPFWLPLTYTMIPPGPGFPRAVFWLQDFLNDSPRGQAFRDWYTGTGPSPPVAKTTLPLHARELVRTLRRT